MPRGASPRREREYEKLKTEFQREGRYHGREAEVAARIVNKQRSQYGETKPAQEKRRKGEAPDAKLPIEGYDRLTAAEIKRRLERLSARQRQTIAKYEREHKRRKSVLAALERQR